MKADKGQFDEVLRRMLAKNPKKTKEIKQTALGFRRRKNPETDPRYLPVFDGSHAMVLTPEQEEQVRLVDEYNREQRKKKKS
jgi:hypothetical protein